jgi:hydrogenase expression/formation protein HypC
MCLAVPGKIIETYEEAGLLMGKIDYSGTVNSACLAYVPEATIGQYVVVHAGFALHVLDEDEAKKTLALWDELVEQQGDEESDQVEEQPNSGDDSSRRDK